MKDDTHIPTETEVVENQLCDNCSEKDGEFKYTAAMDVGDSLMLIMVALLLILAFK